MDGHQCKAHLSFLTRHRTLTASSMGMPFQQASRQQIIYTSSLYLHCLFSFLSLSLSPAGAVKVTSSAGTKWILPEQVPDVLRKRSWLHEIEFFCPSATCTCVAPHGRVQGSEPLEPAPTPALPAGPSSPAPTGKEARWGDCSCGHCPALYL